MLKFPCVRLSARRRSAGCHVLIGLAAVALIASLATRVVHLNVSPVVRAASSHAVRQHLDQDATHWIAPTAIFIFLQSPVSHPHVSALRPALPTVIVDQSLYNRPPPLC